MIIIIGAGLSGLVTAYRLKSQGIPFKILEARNRVGGRINTVNMAYNTPVEMGATWFNGSHKNLKRLLEELHLDYYDQYLEGISFFQPFFNQPANSITVPTQPSSYRVQGGTSAIIRKLVDKISQENIILNEQVSSIEFSEESVRVRGIHAYTASKVILALPPKLWASNIEFRPNMPMDVKSIALQTQTWMEESIKVALTFKKGFWREQGFSGTLFSNGGPVNELYDHANFEGDKFALCGFIKPGFRSLDNRKRKDLVLAQLEAIFGPEVKNFAEYSEQVWSNERYTFVQSKSDLYPHQNQGNPIFQKSYFNERLLISSTETSSNMPGYMEGAVSSGEVTAAKLLSLQQ